MSSYKPLDKLIVDLKKRAKELNCLYKVQELLNKPDIEIDEICIGIVKAIPPGWQYPDVCQAKINLHNNTYQTDNYVETKWVQCADIKVQNEIVGNICVSYTKERPPADEGPFLKEERKLIETIAEQFGLHILHQQLKSVFEEQKLNGEKQKSEWGIIVDLLKSTDPKLLVRISRKMVNYLYWTGFKEAEELLENLNPVFNERSGYPTEVNRPYQTQVSGDLLSMSYKVFDVACNCLGEKEVLNNIQKWIKEDRSGFLVNVLQNTGTSLTEISNAIERFHHLSPHGLELSEPRAMSLRVALIRRLLNDQPDFIHIAKNYITIDDFYSLLHRIIFPTGSHGKLGGKSSGLILSTQILKRGAKDDALLQEIKTPKTWYITSNGILNFVDYNNLEDIVEQKYKDIDQVRQEYPYVIHVFKNSPFPPEIVQGLSLALDDLGDVPLIVRSSSLLEDRSGAAFAGKYKSLFIANQGKKEKRLIELMDAIAEVYASTFGPDPIGYRTEQGLLDYHEEMGIMIQEVVGKKIGHYFFPAFAGVAFSHNDFRWSSRINREDGLVRLVVGLGTRAVDRLSDDYPVLISPGQPNLRVNTTLEEINRYSPKYMDVINLETNSFETIEINKFIAEYGNQFPFLRNLISIIHEDYLQIPRAIGTNYKEGKFVITFEGLVQKTSFVKQIKSILTLLSEKYDHPVDIEFAHDGEDFYLLQCRSQSYSEESKPPLIPINIPEEKIIFSARRYISNGFISNITHLVYVNPQKYGELAEHQDLLAVGRAVGRLNKILPKRQFILMGPGRWGSRGDIKLGVSVTYSDLNNTSMLIEIARKQKDYVPDLSFGTHFFQDLVEANIRYLPLYPDDPGIIFNEEFLENSHNILGELLPEFAHLSNVIKVIDIPASTDGQTVQILMNAEAKEAIAMLV